MIARIIFRGVLVLLFLALPVGIFCKKKGTPGDAMSEEKLKIMRDKMVRSQIEARGVKDDLTLDAMREVPRHQFVSEDYWSQAYSDYPLPIGEGQTISQPYIVALMTELLELKGKERVLEIGTGSGYQAAVLAEIAKEVYTVEIIDALANKADTLLKKLGYKNIAVKAGDGYRGWKEKAPFDAIVITAAPPSIPEPLKKQLKDGGILVAPVGVTYQELITLRKKGQEFESKSVIPVRFVPMTGEVQKKKFSPGP